MAKEHGEAGTGNETRAGLVALVGRPNVGKSTLLNALLGEKLSIVTAREQTTRERVLGILTEGTVQMVFVDTPGLLEPRYLLQHSMLAEALIAMSDADVVLLLLDPTRPDTPVPEGKALDRLRARRAVLEVAINKIDAANEAALLRLSEWSREALGKEARRVSARTGEGLAALQDALERGLPASPFLYPAEDLAAQSVRFFVAELIRETIFEEYEQEIPYSSVVRIEEYRESGDARVHTRPDLRRAAESEGDRDRQVRRGDQAAGRAGA